MAVENNKHNKYKIYLRCINVNTNKAFNRTITDKADFDKFRTYAYYNQLNLYLINDQGAGINFYLFDIDAHEEESSLGEVYGSLIDLEKVLKKRKVRYEELFTGRGFLLKTLGGVSLDDYEQLKEKHGADNISQSPESLHRCPYTFNHNAKRWASPLTGGEHLQDVINITRNQLNSDWDFLIRFAYAIPLYGYKQTIKTNYVNPRKLDISKAEFIELLRYEGIKVTDSGSGIQCPKANEHNNGDANPSAQVKVMKDGVPRILCYRRKEGGKFRSHIFDAFNILDLYEGLKYPQAHKKLVKFLTQFRQKKEVAE